MVDPTGVFTLIVVALIVAGIFTGYYIFDDFTGIVFGVAAASATAYVLRSMWLGIATQLAGGG